MSEAKPAENPGTEPIVTWAGGLDMQVCVPKDWSDNQVKHFADTSNPCGTAIGWHIRRQGDRALADAAEREACEGRAGFVHIMLDA